MPTKCMLITLINFQYLQNICESKYQHQHWSSVCQFVCWWNISDEILFAVFFAIGTNCLTKFYIYVQVSPPPSYHDIPGTVPAHQGVSRGPPPSYEEAVDPNGINRDCWIQLLSLLFQPSPHPMILYLGGLETLTKHPEMLLTLLSKLSCCYLERLDAP